VLTDEAVALQIGAAALTRLARRPEEVGRPSAAGRGWEVPKHAARRRGVPPLEQLRMALAGYAVAAMRERPPVELSHCLGLAVEAVDGLSDDELRELGQQIKLAGSALAWIVRQRGGSGHGKS